MMMWGSVYRILIVQVIDAPVVAALTPGESRRTHQLAHIEQSESSTTTICESPFRWETPLEHGAVGDGQADDSVAVRKALEEANNGCVGFWLPPQRTFKVTPGALRVTLRNAILSLDGTLIGPSLEEWNPRLDGWPTGSCAFGAKACPSGVDPEASRSMFALLKIQDSSNVTIKGSGGITGAGSGFWKVREHRPEVLGYCLLKIDGSSDVSLHGLRLADSPMYHAVVSTSHNVLLENLRVELTGDYPVMRRMNTDGLSIGPDSSFVQIRGCDIASGDDNIVVKRGSRFISASDVTLRKGKGISIGSLGERHSEGSVMDCDFDRVSLLGSLHGARIKTWRGGRGAVSNISFSNFKCDGVGVGILVDQEYCPRSQRPEGCKGDSDSVRIADVRFHNFTGTVRHSAKQFSCKDGGQLECSVQEEGSMLQLDHNHDL